MGKPPGAAQRANCTSPWLTGRGAAGGWPHALAVDDDHWRLGHNGKANVLTHQAKSGPEVAVMALRPATEAPMHMPRAAISSSAWMPMPPWRGQVAQQVDKD